MSLAHEGASLYAAHAVLIQEQQQPAATLIARDAAIDNILVTA